MQTTICLIHLVASNFGFMHARVNSQAWRWCLHPAEDQRRYVFYWNTDPTKTGRGRLTINAEWNESCIAPSRQVMTFSFLGEKCLHWSNVLVCSCFLCEHTCTLTVACPVVITSSWDSTLWRFHHGANSASCVGPSGRTSSPDSFLHFTQECRAWACDCAEGTTVGWCLHVRRLPAVFLSFWRAGNWWCHDEAWGAFSCSPHIMGPLRILWFAEQECTSSRVGTQHLDDAEIIGGSSRCLLYPLILHFSILFTEY